MDVKSIFLSRTVWTAAVGLVVSVGNMLGYHLVDKDFDPAIDFLLFALAGLFRWMATKEVKLTAPVTKP